MPYGTKILKRRGEYKISHCYKCIPKVPWSCKCVLRHILTLFWWQRWVFFRKQEVCVCSVYALFVPLQKYMTPLCMEIRTIKDLFTALSNSGIKRADWIIFSSWLCYDNSDWFPQSTFPTFTKIGGGGGILSKSLFYLM